jgi:hypothetical protein
MILNSRFYLRSLYLEFCFTLNLSVADVKVVEKRPVKVDEPGEVLLKLQLESIGMFL